MKTDLGNENSYFSNNDFTQETASDFQYDTEENITSNEAKSEPILSKSLNIGVEHRNAILTSEDQSDYSKYTFY